MLFAQSECYETEAWKAIKAMRKNFLTRQAVEEHLIYITDYYNKHKKQPVAGKRVYHVIRLLYQLRRMISGEEPQVYMRDGEERDFVMKIKLAPLKEGEQQSTTTTASTINQLLDDEVNKLLSWIDSQRPWNKLPERADEGILDQWLKVVRKQQFLQEMKSLNSNSNNHNHQQNNNNTNNNNDTSSSNAV